MTIKGRKGGKGGGGGSYPFYETPNTLRSKQTARIIDVISEGEIEGLVSPAIESVFFDETPIYSGAVPNFLGITFQTRNGLPTQTHIPGFPATETEIVISQELTVIGGPIVRTITDPDADAVRVKVRIPNLSFFNIAGNTLVPTTVFWQVEIAVDAGPFIIQNVPQVSGKTTTPYEVEYRYELPAGGAPWRIRLTRASPDSSGQNQNKTFWSSNTIVKDVKLSMPDTALVALTVNAEQFGTQVPTRSYLIDGLKIQIPDNYNPTTRVYTGIWTGGFVTAYSNNSAWVYYDLLTSKRYGLGEFVDVAQIDKFGLYAIGQYCDEPVDDGAGGTEPRFVFNGVVNDQREAYQVLNSVVSAFQGMQYWGSGVVTVVQDSPRDPDKLVAPANVIDGEFEYAGSSLKARHSVVFVSWNDPDLGYKVNVEPVEDLDLIAKFGVRKKDVVAFGCTSRSQAKRYGRWILDTEKYSTEAVRYRASLDHADVRPGDIVAIADPAIANVRFGGRVVGFPTPGVTVEVDGPVVIEAGENYEISFVLPDSTLVTVDVTDAPGTYTTLTMASDPGVVAVGAMWSILASNVEPRRFRVIGVSEVDKNVWEVQGILHDPGKYARIEQGLRVEPPPYTTFPTGPIPPPTNLQVTEYLILVAGSIQARATFSWTPPSDARVKFYEVEVRRPDSDAFEQLGLVASVSIDIDRVEPGDYTFRVRAFSGIGQVGAYATLNVQLFGFFAPPADVENCQIENIGPGSVRLTWNPNVELDLAGYEIRYSTQSAATATFVGATLLQTVPKDANSIIVPGLVGSYLIKAFDLSGVRSANACIVDSNILQILGQNFVLAIQEDPDWGGAKQDVVHRYVDDCLQLDTVSVMDDWGVMDNVVPLDFGGYKPLGVYFFEDSVDFGAVFTSLVSGAMEIDGLNTTNVMASWLDLTSLASMSGANTSDYNVSLQIRTTTDDPTGSPVWGPWQDLVAGNYTFWGAEFRITMESFCVTCTPLVCAASVQVSMPDRIEGDQNIQYTPSGYLTITFDFPFFARPAIAVDGEGLAEGDQSDVVNKSATGFDVRFLDKNGVEKSVTFDWIARGYGKRVP